MQSEFEKIYNNYQSQLNHLKVIESLDISDKSKIGLGSLIETDSSILFIGIGLGIHHIDTPHFWYGLADISIDFVGDTNAFKNTFLLSPPLINANGRRKENLDE